MEEKDLKQELVTYDEKVSSIVVRTAEQYELAGGLLIGLQHLYKQIQDYWAEPKKRAHEAHKAICQKETDMLKPVEEKGKLLRSKVNEYLAEQDRIRRDAQAKADRERAEEERKMREKLLAQALKAEEKGKSEKAEELRTMAEEVFVAPVVVQGEVEKTTQTEAGSISQKRDLEVTVLDVLELLKEIVAGTIPASVVTVSEAKLKQYVKLSGIKKLGGCSITEVIKAQVRSKSA